MKRSLAWLWLIGAVLYAVSTWPFADALKMGRNGQHQTPSSSLSSSIRTPLEDVSVTGSSKEEEIAEARTEPIAPQPLPGQRLSVSGVAVENEDSAETTQTPNVIPAERLVVRSAANIRGGPSAKSALVGTAPVGAELDVAEREAGWVRFVDPATSQTGWIHESLLVPFGTELPPAVEQSSAKAAARPTSKIQARNMTRVGSGRDTKKQAGGDTRNQAGSRDTKKPATLGYAQPPTAEKFGPNKRRFGFFARRRMLREGLMSEESALPR